MQITRERYFTIHTPDQPGILAQIGADLMKSSVDCTGIWGATPEPGHGTVTVVPRDPVKFKSVADRASWRISEGVCFMLAGKDRTGALVEIFNQLARDGISITMLDAMAVEGKFACHLRVSDDDIEHVAQVLGLSTPKP